MELFEIIDLRLIVVSKQEISRESVKKKMEEWRRRGIRWIGRSGVNRTEWYEAGKRENPKRSDDEECSDWIPMVMAIRWKRTTEGTDYLKEVMRNEDKSRNRCNEGTESCRVKEYLRATICRDVKVNRSEKRGKSPGMVAGMDPFSMRNDLSPGLDLPGTNPNLPD